MDYQRLIDEWVEWLRERVQAAHARGVIFGLSGGVDSAVVAGLAVRAFPETALGVIMPIDSQKEDEEDAKKVAKKLGLNTIRVDLGDVFRTFQGTVSEQSKLALSNVKPRLRMLTLYCYAQSLGYLVLGCSNRSEFMTGYFTKYGDSGADLLPLASFMKSEVYELARVFDLPKEVIDKKPSAGLWEGQTDEAEMGVTYSQIENYLVGENLEASVYQKIDGMNRHSEHKRHYPPIFIPSQRK